MLRKVDYTLELPIREFSICHIYYFRLLCVSSCVQPETVEMFTHLGS